MLSRQLQRSSRGQTETEPESQSEFPTPVLARLHERWPGLAARVWLPWVPIASQGPDLGLLGTQTQANLEIFWCKILGPWAFLKKKTGPKARFGLRFDELGKNAASSDKTGKDTDNSGELPRYRDSYSETQRYPESCGEIGRVVLHRFGLADP